MSCELKIQATDIVLVTYHREYMLEKTLKTIKERTRFPHRLILVDNGSRFDDKFKKEVIDKYSDLYIKNQESTKFGMGVNIGLMYVKTPYFVTTCNDVIPPDLTPCWLERLSILIESHEGFGGINCRAQYMPRCRYKDESQQVYEQKVMLQSYLRIQRTEEMRSIDGVPFEPKGRHKYESIGFVKGVKEKLNKRSGSAAHIHCNHFGWEEENKGYPQNVDFEFKVHIKKQMPEIDPKTCAPIGHKCPPWPFDDDNYVPPVVPPLETVRRVENESIKKKKDKLRKDTLSARIELLGESFIGLWRDKQKGWAVTYYLNGEKKKTPDLNSPKEALNFAMKTIKGEK